MSTTALAELTADFEQPFEALGRDAVQDQSTVVISWPSVPIEIIRAAGFRPVLARGLPLPTPAADAVLEPGLFPSRLRQLVEAALTGRLKNIAALIVPRTSDSDYKCFLYLREFERLGDVRLPPVLLFDLLQSAGPEVPAYDRARTAALRERLSALAGRQISHDDLAVEIAATNAARAAARRLGALRRGEPRVTGSEAFPLLAAFWQCAPERYAALAAAAVDAFAARSPLTGPRVLLVGAPVDGTGLHRAIGSKGGTVSAESSAFTSAGAGEDVSAAVDPITALADKYRRDSITARLPVAVLERRIEDAVAAVDAVAVSLPPDDASFGFDYPRLCEFAARRSIPHAVLKGEPALPATAADLERIATLLAGVVDRREARVG
ncbi:MAG: 2-hydroxyacyl-CoA dehydratase family protein [Gammaproteobacteria bacterium]